jgi:RNA polymerase sigma-70 factor (ECF subfamily)
MSQAPETRLSLLVRLKGCADEQAWQEFVEIYRPVVCRFARLKGLQDADAEDLAQQVFMAVARSIDRWEPDPARARFRTWLERIAHNLLINMLSRAPEDRAAGGSGESELLRQQPARDGPDSGYLRMQYRREVFRWAARRICGEFQADTWQAFWRTAVEDRQSDEVARQLNKSVGAVYAARSRVMRRLREVVAQWQEE